MIWFFHPTAGSSLSHFPLALPAVSQSVSPHSPAGGVFAQRTVSSLAQGKCSKAASEYWSSFSETSTRKSFCKIFIISCQTCTTDRWSNVFNQYRHHWLRNPFLPCNIRQCQSDVALSQMYINADTSAHFFSRSVLLLGHIFTLWLMEKAAKPSIYCNTLELLKKIGRYFLCS